MKNVKMQLPHQFSLLKNQFLLMVRLQVQKQVVQIAILFL